MMIPGFEVARLRGPAHAKDRLVTSQPRNLVTSFWSYQ